MVETVLEKKLYDAKITSKGQIVIPKPIRDAYGLKEGMRVHLVATEAGILLKSGFEKPWTGLRGLMKVEWGSLDLDSLIKEAKSAVFKPTGVS